jgi:hypothetical protein
MEHKQKYIRGSGLAYSADLSLDSESGLLHLYLYRVCREKGFCARRSFYSDRLQTASLHLRKVLKSLKN